MKRRLFLKYFSLISTWSLFGNKSYILTEPAIANTNKHLDLNDTHVFIQNEKLIFLPEHPPSNHCIYFQFNTYSKDINQVPQIISKTQTIVHQKEPLLLDQPCSFKMIYDSHKKDWYINSKC